jgi:hypothetical protein
LDFSLSDSKIEGRWLPWISVYHIRKSKAGGCLGFQFVRFENQRQLAALDFSLSDSKIEGRLWPWIYDYQIRKSKTCCGLGFQFIRIENRRQVAALDFSLSDLKIFEDRWQPCVLDFSVSRFENHLIKHYI